MSWPEQVAVFLESADSVAELVQRIDDYSAPGLGAWDLRGLTGHTLRGLTTLERYLEDSPAEGTPLPDAPSYLVRYLEERDRDPERIDRGVAERGIAEGETLPENPATAFRDARNRLAGRLSRTDPNLVIPTAWHPMRLADYLRTRNLELVMHGLDLAAAAGILWDPPRPALIDALHLTVDAAVGRGKGPDLARVLGGRLPSSDVLPVLR